MGPIVPSLRPAVENVPTAHPAAGISFSTVRAENLILVTMPQTEYILSESIVESE
jgi:hypothetical protein